MVRDDSSSEEHELPLTGPQLGIWNAQQFDPETGRYLVGEVLEISGDTPIDVDALAESIRRTVAEAENMRLRFRDTPDGARQFVIDAPAVLRPTIDLRAAADPLALAHEAVALQRHQAAEHCRAMVDRQLYNYTLIRVTDTQVWCVQLYHHLIVDGYSAALLSRRVAAHYTALRRGTTPRKATFGTIADLVAEEQAYRDSDQFAEDRQFWRDQLTPWPDLDGRGRHVGGAVERTVRAEATLSADTLATLRECAERYGITWADVLVSCYAAFLNRQLAMSDVVVSMLLMGRVGRAALATPSMAVNVLPLRLTVRGDDRLGELGPRVAEALRQVRAHQRYSGDDLVHEFPGSGASELLHGVGVNLKVFDFSLDFDGARGVLRNIAGGPPEDLGLTVTPAPDGTTLLGFEADARTNDLVAVRRRIDGLVRVIHGFTGAEKPPVGALELIERAEREQLLHARSGPAPIDETELVPDALDRLVQQRPGAVVLSTDSAEFTAAEFGRRVNQLARYLHANGVGPDRTVGIALPRTADFVVALFATWRAGGICLPLDPEHPIPRLRAMIDDAVPALVLGSSELVAELHTDAVDAVAVDSTNHHAAAAEYSEAPFTAAELDNSTHPGHGALHSAHGAYLIYTSGSTGRPKGVLVEHAALAQLLSSHRSDMYRAATQRRGAEMLGVAHTTSFAFDASLDPLLWLVDGHRVRLYDSGIRRDPIALISAFYRDGIDVVDGTPTLITALLDHGLADTAPAQLVLGGDACPPDLWRRIQRAGIPATNFYGPTEAAVDAIGAPVDGEDVRIGQPLPGIRAYLFDNSLQVVADNQIGELYLAGGQLARGYLNRPDATADSFVCDPYGPPGTRMYRTGDRARWIPGRGYEYLGRSDAQVKIRGHRVELAEVETALGGLAMVRSAAADIREVAGRPTLVGYIVAAAQGNESARAQIDSVQLRNLLADQVPDHMVPSRIIALDALPSTVNGKLDRGALPEPTSDTSGRTPSTRAEHAVCEVVAAALEHDAVSVDDDFFAAGGDSITAIGVSSALREHGLLLSPQDLLTRSSLGEIAATAEQAGTTPRNKTAPTRRDTPKPHLVHLEQHEIDALTARYGPIADVLPLSPLQEGLLFHALRDGDNDIYTMTARFELGGVVDPQRLSEAFHRMLDRHPNLGAAFCYDEFDQPVQVLPGSPQVSWQVEDLRDRTPDDAASAAHELEQLAGAHIFDISQPPLLRVLLIRLPEHTNQLVLTAHHLLADGWSVPIMLKEALALYHGEAETMPEPGYYGDYLAWIIARDADRALAQWGEYLDALPAPSLLGIAGRRARTIGRHIRLPADIGPALQTLGRSRGLTMNTLLQGAWAIVLAEQLGSTDVVFGTVVSGRPAELPDVAATVGLFSNTIPVRFDIDPRRPLLDQLTELQQSSLAMQDNGYLGLASVERAVGFGRLFDSLVVFENFPKSGVREAGNREVQITDVAVHSRTHFPVTITARSGDNFDLLLHNDPAAVPEKSATKLAARLGAVLVELASADAATTIDTVSDLSDPAVRQNTATLANWGESSIAPESPAVHAGDETISYAEFNGRVNRLARWLIGRGVACETMVTVAMQRSIDAVVAAHAICRAGGVYLPVDPAQPEQRLEQILDIAAPALILGDGSVRINEGRTGTRTPMISVEDIDTTEIDGGPISDAERPIRLRPSNSAYLLFTSGSTGVPKGVTVTHDAIINTFEWLQQQHGFGAGDTVLYRTPPTFDASMLELFLPLQVGARIVLTRKDGHRDPYYQAELLRKQRVTGLQMTSSMLTVLAEEAELDGYTDLRCVFTGGEPLPPATAQRIRSVTGAQVNNLYGPTEAAVCITYHATSDEDTASVPIGRPPTGAGVRVLDERLRPVTAGAVGDLYLTGVQLARGYLARPDLTSGTFVADPNGRGERMYRTGDLVKWGPHGELEYIGRADSQVKLRGQRIELGDIESALVSCSGVAQAVVLLREDTPGDQRLVAYLIAGAGVELDPTVVRSALAATLPAYMIPNAFVVLDEIPLTITDKIDRKALPIPDYEREPEASPAGSVLSDRTHLPASPEQPPQHGLLAEIGAAMAAVLSTPGIDAIDTDDDFFAAGGHSLTAVRLVGRLRRAGTPVVLDDVFAAPTPRLLAERIADTDPEGLETASDALAMVGRRLDPVLELRTTGSAAPLFCFHPVGGTAWQFGPLARLLRADRPIYGLQLPTLSGGELAARTIDELAQHYLGTIRRIQPDGPYHLLGYSLGGTIVHALAALLVEDGEEVAFAGLVDSHPLPNLVELAERALTDPADLAQLLPELPEDAPELAAAIRAAATELLHMVLVSSSADYTGPMALYAADNGTAPQRTDAALAGWHAAGAEIVARRLPYSHFDIVSPTGWAEVAALLDADPVVGNAPTTTERPIQP